MSRPSPSERSPSALTGGQPAERQQQLSDELARWLRSDTKKTLGSLIDLFGLKSFAIMFVLLLAVPALPLPTAGVTHVFEAVAMLLALQLIVNRDRIWLPERWCGVGAGGGERARPDRQALKL